MAGCNECKFYKSELGDFTNGSHQIIRSCTLGKDEEMNQWWVKNGKKHEGLDDMECHDYHDFTKKLISMINKVEKLSDLLSKE